ncbi:MAG: MotA/TolQ/ExbB proton channel family protein, partial [Prevotella sp.]|nr:MotA/TolQ/ExbB proton channel family protein [Prevotella sp.]
MATTKQAAPAKKSEGFQGVRGAFWIIVVCAIIAFT